VFVFSLGYAAAESYCSVVPIDKCQHRALLASSEKYKGFGLALQVQDVKREEKSYPSTNWLPE
jgi:hypothetical protein